MSHKMFIIIFAILATFGQKMQVESLRSPQDIIEDDMNNEKVIYGATDALINVLNKCDQIVQAVYKVTDYTPNLNKEEHSKFWKQKIIPNLLESVTQNVHARSLIIHSFGSINQLSITIQKSAQIVLESKGSEKAIKIARHYIPEAMSELTDNLNEAMSLDNEGIKRFANQTQELFAIIGPESVKFIEQKAEKDEQLNKLYVEQEQLFQDLAYKQGEATRLKYMIIALGGKPENDNGVYVAIAQTIKNIPDKIKKRIRAASVSGSRLLKYDNKYELDASHKYIDVTYYNTIIRPNTNFNGSLPELQGQYITAIKSLEKFNKEFNEQLCSKQKQIDQLLLEITDITKQIDKQDQATGLNGIPLINCLTAVKAFASTLRTGANIYSPLVSIIKGVRMTVQMDIELLDSNDTNDVMLAVNLLSSRVKFLSSFTLDARFVLDPSNQLNITSDYHHNKTDTFIIHHSSAELIQTNWSLHVFIISLLILINIFNNLDII